VRRNFLRCFLIAVAFVAFSETASAEDLVSGLSQDSVAITSNYAGSTIVVFGAIEHPIANAPRDIVVVVRGPATTVTVRRKDRVAGIWINRDQAQFNGMPAYYFVAGTRPIKDIAASDLRARLGVGLDVVSGSGVHSHHAIGPFRDALIRQEVKAGLYAELPGGVEYLSDTLFRVRVPVPANIARGEYSAQVYLFRKGYVISEQATPFSISNTGLERQIYHLAHNDPVAYGLLAVMVAVLLGWISSLFFRQSA
jgi:uncharacterized protein (TIGR02186 family)